jgi:hypothetical protein
MRWTANGGTPAVKKQSRRGVPKIVEADVPRDALRPELSAAAFVRAAPQLVVIVALLVRRALRHALPADVQVTLDQAGASEGAAELVLEVDVLAVHGTIGPREEQLRRGRAKRGSQVGFKLRRNGDDVRVAALRGVPFVGPLHGQQAPLHTRYNYAQGHMMHWSSTGQYLPANNDAVTGFQFGWDITPAIFSYKAADGSATFALITKENHYGHTGSYCNDDTICPPDRTANNPGYPEQYFIASLGPDLRVNWRYQNTNTLSCATNPNGSFSCDSDHPRPNGPESCHCHFVSPARRSAQRGRAGSAHTARTRPRPQGRPASTWRERRRPRWPSTRAVPTTAMRHARRPR